MSIPGSGNPMLLAGLAGGYEIEQSLRFNSADSAYLNRTPGSTGNRRIYTISLWFKRGKLGETNKDQGLFTAVSSSGSNNEDGLFIVETNQIRFWINNGNDGDLITTQVVRDPSAWYHIVAAVDTTQSTSSNRVKLYLNGVQITQLDYAVYPSQNYDSKINNTVPHAVGFVDDGAGSGDYFNGYLSEINFIDGTALTPSSFGETNDDGVWIPKKYTGSYGTNGFYLKFDPTATNGIGHDHSGNGNNWTANNFSTSGTGTDVMDDTPTTNWCTLNPLEKPGGTTPVYENGNLTLRNSTNYFFAHGVGTFGLNSGKWYFETSGDTSIYVQIGFVDSSQITSMTGGGGISVVSRGWSYQSNGIIRGVSNTYQDTGLTAASTAGDIMGLALNFDAGQASWYVNGTQVGSTVDFSSYLADGRIWYPVVAVTNEGTDITDVNFGQRAFAYTPPTGFKALNTANLPAPTIKDGSKYFDTKLYTGNGTARSIAGLGFSPDFVWIKERNNAVNHLLFDNVRGALNSLTSNSTAAEVNYSSSLTAFNSDGFSLGTASGINDNSDTYVAWAWDANGAGSSNNSGTITSTVSANASAGFSIVSYTGTNADDATVGHGLGVKPAFIIVKNRDYTDYWMVEHSALASNKNLVLNLTNAENNWGSGVVKATNSTVFTLKTNVPGSNENHNRNGNKYIAYCFAEVAGYSKFGSYTGNGSTDGPFVYCGFRPAFVMTKMSSGISNWYIKDTTRDTYNAAIKTLFPDTSDAESSDSTFGFDFLSNGFKVRSSLNGPNQSGQTHIFVAFAENPFGGSGVSPATAR
jgi:hypothetical protein